MLGAAAAAASGRCKCFGFAACHEHDHVLYLCSASILRQRRVGVCEHKICVLGVQPRTLKDVAKHNYKVRAATRAPLPRGHAAQAREAAADHVVPGVGQAPVVPAAATHEGRHVGCVRAGSGGVVLDSLGMGFEV